MRTLKSCQPFLTFRLSGYKIIEILDVLCLQLKYVSMYYSLQCVKYNKQNHINVDRNRETKIKYNITLL